MKFYVHTLSTELAWVLIFLNALVILFAHSAKFLFRTRGGGGGGG